MSKMHGCYLVRYCGNTKSGFALCLAVANLHQVANWLIGRCQLAERRV